MESGNALQELWKELTATKRRLNDLIERVSEYFDAAHEKSQADIEYIAMMSEVDMDEEGGNE